ncbi:hypothetical protein SK128_008212, partial [Halocaridina rubra]
MSDEAHFHLNGMVNQQNCRYWALENPRELHSTAQKMGRRPTQPEHQWTFFAFSSVTASFPDLLTLLGPVGPLICPCVIISCGKTSRH